MTHRSRSPRTRTHLATAYREAGHAVMAWRERIELMPISIFANGRGAGRNVWNDAVRNVDFAWVATSAAGPMVERLATVLVAGPVAQRLYGPRISRGDAYKERVGQVRRLIGALPDGDESSRERFQRIQREAEQAITRVGLRRATRALAMALYEDGTLAGSEVTAIIDRAIAADHRPGSGF